MYCYMLNGLKIYHGYVADFCDGCGVIYPALAEKEGKPGNVRCIAYFRFLL